MLRLILLAVALSCAALPVHAGPVFFAVLSAGGSFGAAFGATALGGFLTTTVGRLLATVALSALERAMQPVLPTAGIRTSQMLSGGVNPVSWIMGRYATAGAAACPPMSHGKVGKTPNAYLTYVIELSDIPKMTLSSLIIDSEEVSLGGTAHADYGLPVLGRFTGFAWVKFYDGSQVAADPMLLAKYGSYTPRPWTSDMIGRGLCYAVMTFRYKREIFNNLPSVRFVVSGIPLYDPRKDTTAGGSGAHRWGNTATYQVTNNCAVMIYNILRGIALPDGTVWGGEAGSADLPYAEWAAAMNACDVSVVGLAGPEPQYQAGIEISVGDQPADIIDELLKSCSGQIVDMGGTWIISVGEPQLPIYAFSDGGVVVSRQQDFDPFPSLSATYNAITATYPDPASLWESKEAPPRYDAALEAEDGGRRLVSSLSFPTVPYISQVQRLMASYIKDQRRFRRHTLTLPPSGAMLSPTDTSAWTSVRNGYSAKLFEIAEIADDMMTCLQQVTLRERDSSDYSWSVSDELPSDPVSGGSVVIPGQTVDGWTVTPMSIADAAGMPRRPAIKMSWSASDMDAVDAIQYEVRVKVTAAVVKVGTVSDVAGGQAIVAAGIVPNVLYQARGLPVTPGRASIWTAWVDVTAPNTGLTNADFGSSGAYQSLFTPDGLFMVRDVATLPVSGTFVGEKVHVTSTGKYYSWNGTVWQMFIADPADASITTASFAAGITPVEIVAALPTTGNFAGRTVYLNTVGKIYRHLGSPSGSSGFTTATDGVDLTPGTLGTAAFASTIRPIEIVTFPAVLPTTGNFAGRTVFWTFDSKIYRHTGSPSGSAGFTVATDGADIIANSITAGQIAAGAISATEIAADAILTKHLAISDTSNLYPDPDFTDPSQYSAVSDFQINANTWGSSRNYLHIGGVTGFTVDKATLGPAFAVNEGLEYQIACKVGVSGSGGASTSLVSIRWYSDIAMTTVISTDAVASNATIGGRTTRVQGIFTAPAGAVRARMRFQRGASATGGVNAVFNEIVIRRAAAGELIVDGSIITAKLAADSVTAGKIAVAAVNAREIATGAIVASKVVVSDFANIFPDYDMADDDFYFTASGAVYSFVGTSAAALGANYLAIAPDAAAKSVFSNWINVEPDTEYLVSGAAWLTSTAAGQGTSTVSVETGSVDSAGAVTLIGGTTVKARTDLGYSSGSHGVIILTTGPTARRARFKLLRAAGGAGSARGGGFKIQKRHNAELLVDGIFAVTGMAAFGGVLQSAAYAESGGIPTAGWQLTQAGTFKGKDIILRDAMTANSVSDKLYTSTAGPLNIGNSAETVLLTLTVGATVAGEIRKYGVAYEFRIGTNAVPDTWQLAVQIRIKYLGVWGPWITKSTQTASTITPTAYEAEGYAANLAGVYDDVQIRAVGTKGSWSSSNTSAIKNLSITCINLVK